MTTDTVRREAETIEHLSRREPESSAAFIVSLAQDGGPVGEQVRTFFMESDGVEMENCGGHDFEVSCAFKRAAALMGWAARSLPAAPVQAAVKALLADDGYGVRCAPGFVVTE
jgi:hypothetical protein